MGVRASRLCRMGRQGVRGVRGAGEDERMSHRHLYGRSRQHLSCFRGPDTASSWVPLPSGTDRARRIPSQVALEESKVRAIIGRLLDPLRPQSQLAEGASVGEADVLVARYGVPDSNVPHGLTKARVTDPGAFDHLIDGYQARAEKNGIPFFLDHGYAHLHPPFAESNMKIGKTATLRSEESGLVGGMNWNLAKESARDAFADAVFDPYGTRFSYRWNDEETYRASDGYDHESRIGQIVEISQLGLSSAQQDTWVFPESVKMRTSIHHTDTSMDGAQLLQLPSKDLPPDLLR